MCILLSNIRREACIGLREAMKWLRKRTKSRNINGASKSWEAISHLHSWIKHRLLSTIRLFVLFVEWEIRKSVHFIHLSSGLLVALA